MLTLIRQHEMREKLRKMSKQVIIDYVNRRGLDVYVPRMRKMAKLHLIENVLDELVNHIDPADELENQGIKTDKIDWFVDLYLNERDK